MTDAEYWAQQAARSSAQAAKAMDLTLRYRTAGYIRASYLRKSAA